MGNSASDTSLNSSWGRDYGDGRVPLVFKTASLSSEVLTHLRDGCPFLSASEEEIQNDPSFERCVDHPKIPSHRYYEGYFHSLKTSEKVKSLDPRQGWPRSKQPAPLPMRALCEAIRRHLTPIILEALQPQRGSISEDNTLASLVTKLLRDGCAFSDLTVQIHAGSAVGASHVGWHTDNPNSLLHMALSLGKGSRALHSMRSTTADHEAELSIDWQREGDVYLSSPACFMHGVQYNQAWLWSNRVIAIQCRFPVDEEMTLLKSYPGSDVTELMICIEKCLRDNPLMMPTLAELKSVEEEMADF